MINTVLLNLKLLANIFDCFSVNKRRVHHFIHRVESPLLIAIGNRNILPVKRADGAPNITVSEFNVVSQTVNPISQFVGIHRISLFSSLSCFRKRRVVNLLDDMDNACKYSHNRRARGFLLVPSILVLHRKRPYEYQNKCPCQFSDYSSRDTSLDIQSSSLCNTSISSTNFSVNSPLGYAVRISFCLKSTYTAPPQA